MSEHIAKPEVPAQEPQYNCAHHGVQDGPHCLKCGVVRVPATAAPSQPDSMGKFCEDLMNHDLTADFDPTLDPSDAKRAAPSQPAREWAISGAKEWRIEWGWAGDQKVPFLKCDGRDGIQLDLDSAAYIKWLMDAAQQSAAKDAEIERLRKRHAELGTIALDHQGLLNSLATALHCVAAKDEVAAAANALRVNWLRVEKLTEKLEQRADAAERERDSLRAEVKGLKSEVEKQRAEKVSWRGSAFLAIEEKETLERELAALKLTKGGE